MILWLLASLPRGQSDRAVGAIVNAAIFTAATVAVSISSQWYAVQLILCSAVAVPGIDTIIAGRKTRLKL